MDRIAPPHTYDELCDAARREVRSIHAAELATLRSNGSKAVVVDVRERRDIILRLELSEVLRHVLLRVQQTELRLLKHVQP